jgi:crossover junction endodeoxyribonuclease RuvC
MKVLGIDPGTNRVGWAVLEASGGRVAVVAYGCIDASRGRRPIEERARIICDGIDEVILARAPECMAIEEAFIGPNQRAALRIGEGRGFAIACAARHRLPVHEYAARTVKKSAVGAGGAHKSQVQEMMRRTLGLAELPEPEDAADALAVALCHCNRLEPEGRDGAAGGPGASPGRGSGAGA